MSEIIIQPNLLETFVQVYVLQAYLNATDTIIVIVVNFKINAQNALPLYHFTGRRTSV